MYVRREVIEILREPELVGGQVVAASGQAVEHGTRRHSIDEEAIAREERRYHQLKQQNRRRFPVLHSHCRRRRRRRRPC